MEPGKFTEDIQGDIDIADLIVGVTPLGDVQCPRDLRLVQPFIFPEHLDTFMVIAFLSFYRDHLLSTTYVIDYRCIRERTCFLEKIWLRL